MTRPTSSSPVSWASLFPEPAYLCYLGLALPQIWLWILLRAIDQAPHGAPVVFYAFEAAALLVVALLVRWVGRAPHVSLAVQVVAALVMGAIPPCIAWASPAGASWLVLGAEALGAALLMACYLAYFARCCTLDLRRAIAYILLSFAVVPVVRLPFDLAPLGVSSVAVGVLPLLFVLAQRRLARMAEEVPARSAGMPLQGRGLKLVVVQLVVYGLAIGMCRVGADGLHANGWFIAVSLVAKVAFPLLVLGVVGRLSSRLSLQTLCQAVLVIMLVGMVVAVNVGSASLTFAIFDFVRYSAVVLMFVALVAVAARTQWVPALVFAAGMGPYAAAVAVGMGLGSLLPGSLGLRSPVLALDVICILTVITVLISNAIDDADMHLFASGAPFEAPVQAFDEIDARCQNVAERYGLSKRELETMQLVCKGRSKRYIAEQLALSENTVRGYAKTLYAKLDVHSRQELLDLLGID